MNVWDKRLMRARWNGEPCEICRVTMVQWTKGTGQPPNHALTLDHILPQQRGGADEYENIRFVCFRCNHSRAITGHCVGALACVRAVAGKRRPEKDVALQWGQWTAWSLRYYPTRAAALVKAKR